MPVDLPRPEVARRLKMSQQATNRWISKAGYKTLDGRRTTWTPERHRSVQWFDWDRADWSKSNIELAKELGASRERCRVMRKKIGRPLEPRATWIRQDGQDMAAAPKPEA